MCSSICEEFYEFYESESHPLVVGGFAADPSGGSGAGVCMRGPVMRQRQRLTDGAAVHALLIELHKTCKTYSVS